MTRNDPSIGVIGRHRWNTRIPHGHGYDKSSSKNLRIVAVKVGRGWYGSVGAGVVALGVETPVRSSIQVLKSVGREQYLKPPAKRRKALPHDHGTVPLEVADGHEMVDLVVSPSDLETARDQTAPLATLRANSGASSPAPFLRALAQLSETMITFVGEGELEHARAVHEAIGKLLTSSNVAWAAGRCATPASRAERNA